MQPPGKPSGRGDDQEARPTSDGMLAIFLAALATALVLAYLFLTGRYFALGGLHAVTKQNCAAIELPSNR